MSNAPPPSILEGNRRKRLKVNSACDACRGRKTRCDGRHPVCLACEKRNCAQYCRYSKRAKGSGGLAPAPAVPRGQPVPFNISLLPATSAKSHRQPSSSTWESPAKESDGLATVTSHDDNSTYGSSSTVAFFRQILSADDAVDSAARLETVQESQPRQRTAANPGARLAVLPRRRDVDEIVSCYWDFIHPMFPILHKSTFYDQYNHAGEAETEAHQHPSYFKSGREHAVFLSLLNLVCALGCQFSDAIPDVQKTSVAYDFYEQSKQSFQHDWLDTADFPVVQLLLLNGVYLQSTQHANRCWNSVGLAIRASQILGLHVEDPRLSRSQLDQQMRRRVWHTCVSLDRLLSMTFGRPTMIHGTNSVPLPLNIDDEYLLVDGAGAQPHDSPSYLSLFVNSCLLLEILRDVLHFINTSEPGAEQADEETCSTPISAVVAQVLALNRRLDQFSKALPSYLCMSAFDMESLTCSNQVGFQKKVLYCRFLLTRLLLLRPILLLTMDVAANGTESAPSGGNLDEGIIRQCCQLCIVTAYNLIDMVHTNLGTRYSSSGWHSVYWIFSSAMILLASLKSNALDIQATDPSFQLHWTSCLAILDYYKGHVCSAAHVIRSLKAVQQRMFKYKNDESEPCPPDMITPAVTVDFTPAPQLGGSDDPSFSHGFLANNDNIHDYFGTNLASLNWLELFPSVS